MTVHNKSMKKILIATTNKEKFKEIMFELQDLQFNFVNLKDLKLDTIEVEEPHDTTWQNALEKARFFAKKTGLLTIAEDTGIFIKHLKGAPGVKSKRFGPTGVDRNKKVLELLQGVQEKNRGAYFETSGCLYDPDQESFSIFTSTVSGFIAKDMDTKVKNDMGYDSIFYYPPLKKRFSEISSLEKNNVSHRGKMIVQLKYFLMKNYQMRQIICAAGILVKDGKFFMQKRRDLRPEFNNKWEFPGGSVDDGTSFYQTLEREMVEEAGVKVNIIEQLPDIMTTAVPKDNYQVHLFICICTIKSGKIKIAEAEASEYGWFSYKEALKMDLLPLNKKIIQSKRNREVLLKYIQ